MIANGSMRNDSPESSKYPQKSNRNMIPNTTRILFFKRDMSAESCKKISIHNANPMMSVIRTNISPVITLYNHMPGKKENIIKQVVHMNPKKSKKRQNMREMIVVSDNHIQSTIRTSFFLSTENREKATINVERAMSIVAERILPRKSLNVFAMSEKFPPESRSSETLKIPVSLFPNRVLRSSSNPFCHSDATAKPILYCTLYQAPDAVIVSNGKREFRMSTSRFIANGFWERPGAFSSNPVTGIFLCEIEMPRWSMVVNSMIAPLEKDPEYSSVP
jgi:hypothetical protein